MKVSVLSVAFLSVVAGLVQAAPKPDAQAHASKQIDQWQKQYNQYVDATIKTRKTGCTADKIVKRQEWGSLSKKSRKEYIKAVQCLQKKAPKYSKKVVPGAQSRYDDFSAAHIIQTPAIHFSGLFFHWHRYFVWLYEKALREECGYTGYQPYWDWTLSWEDIRKSTVFDGSPYSMGSNGKVIPHGPTNISAFGLELTIEPATGGGCVHSGPFQPKDYKVSLGPIAFEPKGKDGGLAYNPRCLARDLSSVWSNHTKPTDIVTLINNSADLGAFDTNLEDINGVHAGGHFAMGGLGLDAYASAGDPAFYLHHAQVDRVWTLWQHALTKNVKGREMELYGTSSAFNNPPTPNVTADTTTDFGVLAKQQKMGDLGSAINGPFCYVYV